MQFRWVVFIALWSTLVGPILATPSGAVSRARPAIAPLTKPAPHLPR